MHNVTWGAASLKEPFSWVIADSFTDTWASECPKDASTFDTLASRWLLTDTWAAAGPKDSSLDQLICCSRTFSFAKN